MTVLEDFDYCFSENGLTAYRLGKPLASQVSLLVCFTETHLQCRTDFQYDRASSNGSVMKNTTSWSTIFFDILPIWISQRSGKKKQK
jgi:hypothetical protein